MKNEIKKYTYLLCSFILCKQLIYKYACNPFKTFIIKPVYNELFLFEIISIKI